MAQTTELVIALVAKDLASQTLEHVAEKFHGLGAAGKLAGAAVAGFAGIASGVFGGLTEMANSAAHAADEVRKLARETGLSAEESSKLVFAGEKLGIDTADLSKSFGLLSKNIESAHPHLAAYHIDIAKAKDGTVDMGATMDNIADRFKSMPDGVEKTALALQIFGKGGKDMIPFLNEGSRGLHDLGVEAEKLGLVFSKDGLESARQYGLAQKELGERFEGMKNQVGMAVVPILAKLFKIFSDAADAVLPTVKEALMKLAGVFKDLVDAIRPAMEIAGEIFEVITGRAPDAGAALTAALGKDIAKTIMTAVAGIREAAKEAFKVIGEAIGFVKEHMDIFGPAFAAMVAFVIVPAFISWGIAATGAAIATVVALIPVMVPILAIGTAVALLALAWNNNFLDIQGKTKAAVDFLLGVFDGFRMLVLTTFRAIVEGVTGAINAVIGVLNVFVEGYDALATTLGLPLLGKITLITPNLDAIDMAIANVARDRSARINVYENAIQGGGGSRMFAGGFDGIVNTATRFIAGEAGPEHVKVTPLGTPHRGDRVFRASPA